MYKDNVRDDVLQLTEAGNVIVATQDGRLLSLTPLDEQKKNAQKTLEDTYYPASKLSDPALPPLPKTEKSAKPNGAATLIAFDASDYRYQYDPATHSILKWDQSGTRKRSDIGLGKLIAPTRMTVDARGGIYLIDEHKIKYIDAYESTDLDAAGQFESERTVGKEEEGRREEEPNRQITYTRRKRESGRLPVSLRAATEARSPPLRTQCECTALK